jgi:hypothetical protein
MNQRKKDEGSGNGKMHKQPSVEQPMQPDLMIELAFLFANFFNGGDGRPGTFRKLEA